MKWIDYRDLLGVGMSDNEKVTILKNKLFIVLDELFDERFYYNDIDNACRRYFYIVGEMPKTYSMDELVKSVISSDTVPGIISKAVVFGNIYDSLNQKNSDRTAIKKISQVLTELNILHEMLYDEGDIFIIPKGAKELDDALINTSLTWLSDYPKSRKMMFYALKSYSRGDKHSVVADNFRKCLEMFFKEFFHSDKSLENMKIEYGTYMKEHQVPKQLSNTLEALLSQYYCFMNEYAKHNDKTSKDVLEFIMYQTCIIIRFVITLHLGRNRL